MIDDVLNDSSEALVTAPDFPNQLRDLGIGVDVLANGAMLLHCADFLHAQVYADVPRFDRCLLRLCVCSLATCDDLGPLSRRPINSKEKGRAVDGYDAESALGRVQLKFRNSSGELVEHPAWLAQTVGQLRMSLDAQALCFQGRRLQDHITVAQAGIVSDTRTQVRCLFVCGVSSPTRSCAVCSSTAVRMISFDALGKRSSDSPEVTRSALNDTALSSTSNTAALLTVPFVNFETRAVLSVTWKMEQRYSEIKAQLRGLQAFVGSYAIQDNDTPAALRLDCVAQVLLLPPTQPVATVNFMVGKEAVNVTWPVSSPLLAVRDQFPGLAAVRSSGEVIGDDVLPSSLSVGASSRVELIPIVPPGDNAPIAARFVFNDRHVDFVWRLDTPFIEVRDALGGLRVFHNNRLVLDYETPRMLGLGSVDSVQLLCPVTLVIADEEDDDGLSPSSNAAGGAGSAVGSPKVLTDTTEEAFATGPTVRIYFRLVSGVMEPMACHWNETAAQMKQRLEVWTLTDGSVAVCAAPQCMTLLCVSCLHSRSARCLRQC